MFENLIRDASMPVVLDLIAGLRQGLMATIQTEQTRMDNEPTFENAIRYAKLDVFMDFVSILDGMKTAIEAEHKEKADGKA